MTIQEALVSSQIPKIETEILLAAVLNKDRSFVNSFRETILTKQEDKQLQDFANRRLSFEPIPYIVGFKEFYGLNFLVNQNVLIPRPETETLVEEVLNYCAKQDNKSLTVVDIGTGSGCIAISLVANNSNLKLIATDVSKAALNVARKNTKLHDVGGKIKFIQSDLLKKVDQKFDVIVANLPYIPTTNYEQLTDEIRLFEPKLALDSGKTSTILYKKLFKQARDKLKPEGTIFYEIDGGINQVSAAYLAETLPG